MRCRMRHLQLTYCSSCRLAWTADQDPAYPFDIFARHTWTSCTFLVQNTASLPKLLVPGTYRWSWWWRGGVSWYVVLKRLWTSVSDFASINHSTHCAFSCGFITTDLIHKDGCSAVENNGRYILTRNSVKLPEFLSQVTLKQCVYMLSYRFYSRVKLWR
jgi:hypothetical protein